jgi:periplasmic protein TonB
VPSGVDIDQLRVVLRIQLSRDGRVTSVSQVGELSGKTDSNAPQQKLFIERAERSIRQASPFDLPDEYYDQWKVWDVTFRAKGM